MPRATCPCLPCAEDRHAKNCGNPHSCATAVHTRLSQLLPKWDPRTAPSPKPVRVPDLPENTTQFLPPEQITHPTDGLRILTKGDDPEDQTLEPQQRDEANQETLDVYLEGRAGKDAEGVTWAGGGVWYGIDDARNTSVRLPATTAQTAKNAEVHAALICAKRTHPRTVLRIHTRKGTLRNVMTRDLGRLEDKGWIKVADRAPLQALAAELKNRTATTLFVVHSADSADNAGCEGALCLAREGSRKASSDDIDLSIRPETRLRGVKLSSLAQAIAYAGIREKKKKISRPATENRIKQVQSDIHQTYRRLPSPSQIWKSIRHKDFTRQIKNFMWKSMHDAHRIGKFWKHIPECEGRGICQFCPGETEDLEHILLKCQRPGREIIWRLAEELWLKKNRTWPQLSVGNILGRGLASFTGDDGKPLTGDARLYRILISESMYMIWKVRCDCVIGKAGEPLSQNEIHNRWLHAINDRLNVDRILTNQSKYGKNISIRPSLVLETWSSTLKDEEDLPEIWLKEPKVLVGVEPLNSSPPATQSRRRRS
ncbi:hypothetical protein DFH09DRAFT_925930 [Mycena vulgaris]|nr:hypothetical protein DFH09DRAFT_925930 [Mycena vulgaris]